MVVKLSNAAINEYDLNNNSYIDNDIGDGLGMGSVSISGRSARFGGAGAGAGAGAGGDLTASTYASNKQRGAGGGAGAGPLYSMNGAMSVSGSVPGVSYGKDFEYLLQSQVDATNELVNVPVLHLTLTGIAVIDLRSVHTIAPNSPSVNLACGKVVATTNVSVCACL